MLVQFVLRRNKILRYCICKLNSAAGTTNKIQKMSSNNANTGTAAANDSKPPKIDLGLLEEDDEFEEFPAEDGNEAGKLDDEAEIKVWEDNWDDDNVEDDFSEQLRKELEAVKNPKK